MWVDGRDECMDGVHRECKEISEEIFRFLIDLSNILYLMLFENLLKILFSLYTTKFMEI